eukprot:6204907-Pleurochrysis_carterae.AAC.2
MSSKVHSVPRSGCTNLSSAPADGPEDQGLVCRIGLWPQSASLLHLCSDSCSPPRSLTIDLRSRLLSCRCCPYHAAIGTAFISPMRAVPAQRFELKLADLSREGNVDVKMP